MWPLSCTNINTFTYILKVQLLKLFGKGKRIHFITGFLSGRLNAATLGHAQSAARCPCARPILPGNTDICFVQQEFKLFLFIFCMFLSLSLFRVQSIYASFFLSLSHSYVLVLLNVKNLKLFLPNRISVDVDTLRQSTSRASPSAAASVESSSRPGTPLESTFLSTSITKFEIGQSRDLHRIFTL